MILPDFTFRDNNCLVLSYIHRIFLDISGFYFLTFHFGLIYCYKLKEIAGWGWEEGGEKSDLLHTLQISNVRQVVYKTPIISKAKCFYDGGQSFVKYSSITETMTSELAKHE